MISKLFVYPVDNNSVYGRKNFSITNLTTGETTPTPQNFARGVIKSISASASSDNSTLLFGLEEMVDNPVAKEKDVALMYKDLKGQDKISLQNFLEMRFNLPLGTLTQKKGPSMDPTYQGTMLENFFVDLKDKLHIFTSDTLEGCLSIQLLKNSSLVAPSKKEINSTKHLFYIGSEFEEEEQKSAKRQRRFEAIAGLQTMKKERTPFLIYQVAVSMGLIRSLDTNDNVAVLAIENKFDEHSTPHIDEFLTYVELAKDEKGMREIYINYLLTAAQLTGVINTKMGEYLWVTRDQNDPAYKLGRQRSAVIELFLKDFMAKNAAKDFNFYNELYKDLQTKNVRL